MEVTRIFIDEKMNVNLVTDNKLYRLCTYYSSSPDIYAAYEEDISKSEESTQPVTILNTSILTEYGQYSYHKISLDDAKKLVITGFRSAVGHESTAKVISTLLGVDCPVNRIQYKQGIGETALVFKLNGRPKEGQILTFDDIEAIGYTWGRLKRMEA